jgi:hypothetical protein
MKPRRVLKDARQPLRISQIELGHAKPHVEFLGARLGDEDS